MNVRLKVKDKKNSLQAVEPPMGTSARLARPTGWQEKRVLLLSLGFFLVVAVGLVALGIWAWVGNLEESVPGVGQLVPEGKLRRVMSPINGIVVKVHVHENQPVKAGQVLVELDPQAADIEESAFETQLAQLEEEANALWAASASQNAPASGRSFGTIHRAWIDASRQAYQAQSTEAAMTITESKHRYQEAMERAKQAKTVLATSEQLLAKYRALFEEGGLAEKDLQEYEQKVEQQRGELAALNESVQAAKVDMDQAKQRPQQVVGTYQKELFNRLADHERTMSRLRHEVEKSQLTQKHQFIVAPVDGIVNEQSVRGPGDVVAASQVLMSLVPTNAKLLAEVRVSNRDLSYIHLKQRAALRLDAFPYQTFGRLFGVVESISPYSQNQQPLAENTGSPKPPAPGEAQYYVLTVRPDKMTMNDGRGRTLPMRPGMTLTADIITREKNILSFFTEPIQSQLDKAWRDPTNQ